MSVLETEVLEKLLQLDEPAQLRIIRVVMQRMEIEQVLWEIDRLTSEENDFIVQLNSLNRFDEEKYRAIMNALNTYASLVREMSVIDKRAVRLLVGLLTFVDYSTFKSYPHGERVRQAQDEIVQFADRLAWARTES